MEPKKFKALLVYPVTPNSYWKMDKANRFVLARAAHIPLPLVTLAALLPREWELQLVDLNVESLSERGWKAVLRQADVILISGMVIHKDEIAAILGRCKAAGKPAVVGGPFASSEPRAPELAGASAVFVGEAEGSTEFARLVADIGRGAAQGIYGQGNGEKPLAELNVVPRFDLLRRSRYVGMSIQASRGCPCDCEFCDVTARLGKKPRYKTAQAIVAELQALYDLGIRGSIFFADDNFIGNGKRAREIVAAIREWQDEHGRPFTFYTQTVISLAEKKNEDILIAMREAGFYAVFIGLETPSKASLIETHKMHAVEIDAPAACAKIRSYGLLVMAGGIIGFDADDKNAFEKMRRFIEDCRVTMAMVGLLTAIVGTKLYERMRKEERLGLAPTADPFSVPNFRPKGMMLREELEGYCELLTQLYNPQAYFARAERELSEWGYVRRRKAQWRDYYAAIRSFIEQGVFSSYRREYWRFMRKFIATDKVSRAFCLAVIYCHFRSYTFDTVIPRLKQEIAKL